MAAKSPSIIELEDLKRKKLWHQLTLKLLDYIQTPEVVNNANVIKKLYTNFIEPAQNKMNPLSYIKILSYVINQFTYSNDVIKFIKEAEPKVANNKEALMYCKILQGEIYFERLKDYEATLKILEDIEEMLKDVEDSSFIDNRYYHLASSYYLVKGKHTEYYHATLRYLDTTDIETLSTKDQTQYAFLLSLSVLLSEDIYNIAELLQHRILESLKYSPSEWIIDLLQAFNSGNVNKFKELTPKWSSISDLLGGKSKLCKKISLLCLVEMAFRNLPKPCLTFEEISTETQLPENEVEFLVMRALSLGLVKGTIDQVSKEVNLNWVKPKLMDKSEVNHLVKRMDCWIQDLDTLTSQIVSDTDSNLYNEIQY